MEDRVVSREEVHIEKHDAPVEEVQVVDVSAVDVAEIVAGQEEAVSPEFSQVEYEELAMKIVLAIQNILRMQDMPAAIMLHPTLFDGVKEALFQIPEQSFPAEVRDRIQFVPEPNVQVKIVTENEIEMGFLRSYFGPQGNGLLPRLQEYLRINQVPVSIDLNFLRTKYLLEQCEKVAPGIVRVQSPIGSELITGLRNDKR